MRKPILPLAAVALLALPAVAVARIASNTIEPGAELSKRGLRAEVGVLLRCDREQRARVRVTVSQEGQGALRGTVARGRRTVACTTAEQTFGLKATATRNRRLREGDATACALAVTADDVRQWCKEITLE